MKIRSRLGEIDEFCRSFKYSESAMDSNQIVYELAYEIQIKVSVGKLKLRFYFIAIVGVLNEEMNYVSMCCSIADCLFV